MTTQKQVVTFFIIGVKPPKKHREASNLELHRYRDNDLKTEYTMLTGTGREVIAVKVNQYVIIPSYKEQHHLITMVDNKARENDSVEVIHTDKINPYSWAGQPSYADGVVKPLSQADLYEKVLTEEQKQRATANKL